MGTPAGKLPRLFGSPLSPYSMKTRAYLRFKGIAHEWVVRTAANMEEFNRHARLPLVPLWLPSAGPAMQDSTPIIDHLEHAYPEPAVMPADAALAFIGWVIEEYADEWVNRLMAHFRWFHDGTDTARRTVRMRWPEGDEAWVAQQTELLLHQRVPTILAIAGASRANARALEGSFDRLVQLLDAHLRCHRWLLGAQPSVADFALAGQLQQCAHDPTAGRRLQLADVPHLLRWVEAAMAPPVAAAGRFASWQALAPTLVPLLRDEIGPTFLQWSVANAAGEPQIHVTMPDGPFELSHQRYSSVSLRALARRCQSLDDVTREAVVARLADGGLGSFLESLCHA